MGKECAPLLPLTPLPFSVNFVQEPLNTFNSSLLPLSCHVVDDPQTYLGIFPCDVDGISN
jgi:hypothetical protein